MRRPEPGRAADAPRGQARTTRRSRRAGAGTGIDYLRLLDGQHPAALAGRINYAALTSKNTDRQGEDEKAAPAEQGTAPTGEAQS
ncbi:MAG: hypothetical protein K0R62_54 [Nonomuraea muscovyensis]|nr:hypothetical protein [Nonomuraea muscovyensis]